MHKNYLLFPIKSIMLMQLVLCVLVYLVFWIFSSHEIAFSALAGGVVIFITNIYFALRVFTKKNRHDPQAFMKTFYRSEIEKIFLLAVLVSLCVKYVALIAWSFIVGLVIVQFGFWIAPFILGKRKNNND